MATERFPDRFKIERKIGAGGFGVVYAAFDRKRNARVAIKTLNLLDPAGLYFLKHEFRSLAGLVHPNLATLFELFTADEQCFLTMELVNGVSFVKAMKPRYEPPVQAVAPHAVGNDETISFRSFAARPRSAPEWQRLRDSMLQLTQGVAAIHEGGLLHRDIKPSNVLVEAGGRVVLLDFGMVGSADLACRDGESGGTPRYMAPEQGAGSPTTASDWYSAGVMLHECLTGQAPEPNGPNPLLEPGSDVPPDLRDICMRMIALDPGERPKRDELLWVFSGGSGESVQTASTPERLFVGRAGDLTMLEAAMAATAGGSSVVARIRGASGIGKSALCHEFERLVRLRHPEAQIFATRCHDRESVRYKAIDGVVDGISQFLTNLSNVQAERYLPRDIGPLARVFPVLSRVAAVQGAQLRAAETTDAQELRRRAFAALREMLGRMAVWQPVVLFVDDLQWSDLDSVPLLEAILREPDSPGILLVTAWRADEESNPALVDLLPILRARPGCEITLGDLPLADAVELARSLAPSSPAAEVVRQAGGNPFLIDAYLRHALDPAGLAPDIESVIEAQILRLPEAARPVLELLSLAGRPLAPELLPEGADPRLYELLLSERLVRIRTGGELEPYHDRVRDAIAARMTEERRRERHLWLARKYAGLPEIEPEAVAQQFHAGGDLEAAAKYAERAGDLAESAFAFNRAAALYQMALANPRIEPPQKKSLLWRLGDAFTGAGMAFRSAEAYQAAAAIAPPTERIDLLRLAGERLLVSGYINEGAETMAKVARSVGVEMPRSTRAALFSLVTRRIWLRVRGLGFRPRTAEEVPARDLQRIDVCASLVSGFAAVDPFRAFDFQARTMIYALRAGEPVRIARALAMEVPAVGGAGTRNWEATKRALALARSLAESTRDPAARHLLATTSAIVSFFAGRWEEAVERLRDAESVPPPEGSGSAWVNSSKVLFGLVCSLYSGEVGAVRERLPDAIADARGRGDLQAETTLLCRCGAYPLLASDNPERMRTQVREAIAKWSDRNYFLHHFWALLAEAEAALYTGDVTAAWERVRAEWPAMQKSRLFEMQIIAIEALHMRARLAIALAASGPPSRKALIAQATGDIGKLESERAEWGIALALLLRAGIARLEQSPRAGAMAHQAAVSLAECGMRVHAAAARRRGGEWSGDPAPVAEADAVMAQRGIRNPGRFTAMLAPG